MVALFAILSFGPGALLTNALQNLCFTTSERLTDGGDWVLPEFGDYMLSRCPPLYSGDPTELYPNVTSGCLAWGHGDCGGG